MDYLIWSLPLSPRQVLSPPSFTCCESWGIQKLSVLLKIAQLTGGETKTWVPSSVRACILNYDANKDRGTILQSKPGFDAGSAAYYLYVYSALFLWASVWSPL